MNNTTNTDISISEIKPKREFFLKRIQQKITTSKSSYLGYCFIIPAIIMYLIYLAMEIHPFGDGSVLVLDLNAQYVYFFEALRNFIHGDSELLYSFSRALGGEFIGMYAYYIASPLSFIVALFPKERMLEALLTLFLLKTGLCGLTFGYYLHKNSRNTNKVMVVAFSVMYALCAYAVVHQNNTMWIDALIWLPLLTYGIEQLVKFGKYKLFVISLALTVWSNYYIGYMVCIYVAAYFVYYMVAYGDGRNNPRGEKAHNLRSFIRIAVFSAIALAMVAFIILGAYYSLGFGKNDFSNPNWAPTAKFKVLDFLTKFLPGSYDTVRPEGLPFVYTGLLTVILLPIYFTCKKISIREKIASGAFIGFFLLSFILSTIDLIWHGFQIPNWLNARYSFMFCFFLLVLAYRAFGNLRKVSEKFILAICAFLVLFVAVAEKIVFATYVKSEGLLLTLQTVWLSIFVIAAFLAILCTLIKTKHVKKRENISGILAAVICIEIFCSALTCVVQFDRDVVYSGYNGYNNFLKDSRQITELVKENDTSFYRMEKVTRRTVNDNMALGLKGLSNSTSTLNASTIKFLNLMGYTSKSHWSQYAGGTPVNDSLLGIKYIVDSSTSPTAALYYSPAYTAGTNVAYLNPYALSIAYGVDKNVNDFKMENYSSHFDRLNALVAAMLGDSEPGKIFLPIEITDVSTSGCQRSNASGHNKYAAETTGNASVTFTITAPETGEVFFYPPSDYKREAEIVVNGSNRGTLFGNDTDRIISLGVYEAGDQLKVKLTLKAEDLYLKGSNYFYYLDMDAYKNAFERLNANPQFVVSEGHTDAHMQGTISTAKDSQTILTTIPYDEGWKIYLDGEEIETYQTLDALIAFDISTAGAHTLEMKYAPDIYTVGMIISIVGILLFVSICFVELTSKVFFYKVMKIDTPYAEEELWVLDDFDEDAEQEKLLTPEELKEKTIGDYLRKTKEFFLGKKAKDKKTAESNDENEAQGDDSDDTNGGN